MKAAFRPARRTFHLTYWGKFGIRPKSGHFGSIRSYRLKITSICPYHFPILEPITRGFHETKEERLTFDFLPCSVCVLWESALSSGKWPKFRRIPNLPLYARPPLPGEGEADSARNRLHRLSVLAVQAVAGTEFR